jgi:DNA-binding NtrC family response regulator
MARITVVNDYPDFLDTMYGILDGVAGHSVAGFDGTETTLEQIVATRPELLIIDLRIAGYDTMRGWDILVLARADEELRDVPIIVCSADVESLRAREAELAEIGNIYTLEKPFNVDDVTGLVARVLSATGAAKAAGA